MIETKRTLDFLRDAMTLVEGDRALEYGDKVINHNNIAKLWSAYLDQPLTGHEVAVMMCLLKIARTKIGKRTRDTYAGWRGIHGYRRGDTGETKWRG